MNSNDLHLTYDSDSIIELNDYEADEIFMPLPNIDLQPHLLISKVRKHYMDYLVKLLVNNFENNRKLLNKNGRLPSAIWKCAKNIETNAAQACMVVQIYRKNILTVIKDLQDDTKKKKLNSRLSDCLTKPNETDKNVQTMSTPTDNYDCECLCSKRKKRLKTSGTSPVHPHINNNGIDLTTTNIQTVKLNGHSEGIDNHNKPLPFIANNKCDVGVAPIPSRPSSLFHPLESHDSDDLMSQLQKIFYSDDNSQEDDLFEGGVYDAVDNTTKESVVEKPKPIETRASKVPGSIIENHAAQIKSLDERLASLTGLLLGNNESNVTTLPAKTDISKTSTKVTPSKWMCEEYFMKSSLYELLYEMVNRKKLARIKQAFIELFGEDSEEEDIVSPLDETQEFVVSCKERIAPWVVSVLTPLYVKGRIKDKNLFKSLTRHLLKIIYKCSKYPKKSEVFSFVSDFMENHKVISCEADFMKFRIQDW